MAEASGGEGSLGELVPPSDGPPQSLSQGFPGELPPEGSRPEQSDPGLPPGEEEEEDEDEDEDEEEEPQEAEGEFDGVLDEDTVAEGLHELGHSASGVGYVYLNLALPGRELSDINILSRYIHLQKLELSHNKINDLSCISHMPHLLELNASNNELTTYFAFKPPTSLKEVDFSHNEIPQMQDLSAYQSLTKLLLDFNNIEEIRGLEKCHSLTHLSLSHNRLIAISGLENLPIKILNLSSNQIEKITGLDNLKTLQNLDLSRNKITSLRGLEEHDLLEVINLENNQIADLRELEHIEDLPLLRVLNLLNNPVQKQTDYWLLVIFMLLRLTELDLQKISVKEKVAAVNKYDPPPELVAAEDHMNHVMYSMLQPLRVLDSTLPSLDTPYPMLVLAGPLACGKRELTLKVCKQFSNFFRHGLCHTTRKAYFGEENKLDYYFISQEAFGKMVNTGKFILTYKHSDYYYGLARDTVESVAREGLATCVHLEIEGVHSLKKTYFKPRYILVLPTDTEKYKGHLRRKGIFSRPEIEEAVSRVDMYIRISEDIPGYFDAVVSADDLEEAFTELSFLIKAYLGLEPPVTSESTHDLESRAGAGSSRQLLQEQRLSPGGIITGTAQSSSVNEFLDSSAKIYPGGILDNPAAQLHPVEEASLQRRHQAARQALSEKALGAYVQLFQRDLAGTAAPNSFHQPFLEPPLHSSLLSDGRSTTQNQSFPLPTPQSSCRESSPGAGRLLATAGAAAGEGLMVQSPVPRARLPGEAKAEHQDPRGAENGVDRLKEPELPSDNLQRKHSKSKTGSPHGPQLLNCPVSQSKPVLPPIPSGRNRTNP
ncbi:PREDICTED: leucine-rich repeat and guanylate kinase domain-containing protein [Chaetura pelagica]|uniref:leucine-rich repeat and guanylate kinase domain-containing protein n=1 Tax=Chaetura pelagica TaxID=8897 RepID=UPI000523A2B9|nr:PREDICTED: leucine-rich repeat and guanylate kinase domain-containing protein [Chaetura pelagica]